MVYLIIKKKIEKNKLYKLILYFMSLPKINNNFNNKTIILSYKNNNIIQKYEFCSDNIKWFCLNVNGKTKEAQNIAHSPSKCCKQHYNPKNFNNKKLCGYALSSLPCPFGKKCNMLHTLEYPQIIQNENELTDKTINLNNKIYNSAGVLIISEYNDKNYLILFKSSTQVNRGKNLGEYYYGMAGGGINNKDDTIESAARRELYEESCKTVMISDEILKNLKNKNSYVEIIGKTLSGQRKAGLFACYICNLDIIKFCIKSFYDENKKIIKDSTMDYAYNETQAISMFDFDMIKKELNNLNYNDIKPIKFKNNEDNYNFIDERTLKCIWKMIKLNNNSKLSNYQLIDNDDKTSSFYFE